MTNFWLKLDPAAMFAPTLNGNNLAIFHLILMFDHTQMMSFSRKFELC